MEIKAFYDTPTHTLTYVVWDPQTRDAIVIDPVLNYNPLSSQTSTESADEVRNFILQKNLTLHWSLETHAHADHLSGGQLLKRWFGAKVAIGEKITLVQETFKGLFSLPDDFKTDGSQFDKLVADNEIFEAGSLKIKALATPGHTPACLTYQIKDAIFTGDSLFLEDYGTGRTDFPKGSAYDLYHSLHEGLYKLPDETRVFVGHDYPQDRPMRYETTIGASKAKNPQLKADTSQEDFVKFRQARDKSLAAPRLLFQSVQININAGVLPAQQAGGQRYLKLPINLFHPTDDIGEPRRESVAAE